MVRHICVVALVAFAVDGLLLLGAAKLTCWQGKGVQLALGAMLAAVYTAACLWTGRMSGGWQRFLCLVLVAVVSFGAGRKSIYPAMVYIAMSVGAGLLAKGLGDGHGAVAGAIMAAVCLLRQEPSGERVWVKLRYGTKELSFLALRDTGNYLRDPLTGESVLVLGADAAQALLGLELQQLQDPINTVAEGVVRGLRLLPVQTVAGKGLLLVLRIPDAQIGGKRKSSLVAFAPCDMNERNGFYGLTGGMA